MSRTKSKGRMLRSDISKSKKIASLSDRSLILFFMMIPHLNSFGKMNGSPHFIKGEVVPLLDQFTVPVIERCLSEISDKTSVKWFNLDGLFYIHSVSWEEHQELREDRRGQDLLPNYSGSIPGVLHPEVEVEVEVEVKGKVEGGLDKPAFEEIVKDLNLKTGKEYKHTTKHTRSLIQARWNDGFRVPEFCKVHANMTAKWLTDPKMAQYLRPETLYGPKFESYLNTQVTLSDKGIVSATTEKSIAVGQRWIGKEKQEGKC